MREVRSFAAKSAGAPLGPHTISRRDLKPHDVLIEIDYCGVCHSDIHQVRDEWGGATFPMVPGHEIVGKITQVGAQVSKFKTGDLAGVGCFVDSCRKCESCGEGLEQYCEGHMAMTYNGTEADEKTPTYGGYSTHIVVDENYTLRVPRNLDLAGVAPLLCAGITTYSPMRHWKVSRGQKVGVVGLGGLGHMAIKFAASFGADVTVFSTSRSKEADARKLGANHFVVTNDPGALDGLKGKLHYIIDTVSASHDLNQMLDLLRRDGTMTLVGVPPEAPQVHAFSLIPKRRQLTGSLIGGIRETQEMLDYCGDKNIVSDIEVIPAQQINTAYDRMVRGDVKYRFVIDVKKSLAH
jgi:uncharacterized zinc-type alcohol dehydrogenase-like protein